MTKLKICGLRDVRNACAAASAGADYLGFVFVPGVPRQLSVDNARTIIEECRLRVNCSPPQMVGLFADQPIDEVNFIVESCRLDLVQLCGDEVSQYWQSVDVPVIKQIKVRDYLNISVATDDVIRRVGEVVSLGYTAVLDKYESGAKGGTGITFDWDIATSIRSAANNVLQAIEDAHVVVHVAHGSHQIAVHGIHVVLLLRLGLPVLW